MSPLLMVLSGAILLTIGAGCSAATPTAEVPTATAAAHKDGPPPAAGEAWTCSMHRQIREHGEGSCPICGMTLVKESTLAEGEGDGHDEHEEGGHHMGGMDGHMKGMDGHMGGHMAHMNEVKAKLQAKLGAAYDVPVAGLAGANIAAGAAIYAKTCSACHGKTGKGDGPAAAALPSRPADHTDPDHAGYYSDAGRMEVIKHGIEGTPMAGFGGSLSDKELLDLYAYVASLRVGGGGHHDHGDGDHDHGDGDHDHGDGDHGDGDHDHGG